MLTYGLLINAGNFLCEAVIESRVVIITNWWVFSTTWAFTYGQEAGSDRNHR